MPNAVAYLPAGFMMDGATYKRGGGARFRRRRLLHRRTRRGPRRCRRHGGGRRLRVLQPAHGGRGVGAHPAAAGPTRRGAGLRAVPRLLGAGAPARRGRLRPPGRAARTDQRHRVAVGSTAVRGMEDGPRAERSQGSGPATAERPAGAARCDARRRRAGFRSRTPRGAAHQDPVHGGGLRVGRALPRGGVASRRSGTGPRPPPTGSWRVPTPCSTRASGPSSST